MQIRTRLKKIFPSALWPALRKIDAYVIYFTYVFLFLRKLYKDRRLNLNHSLQQSIPLFQSKIPFSAENDEDLGTLLYNAGISSASGRHSVYVSSRSDVAKINEKILDCYPEGSGIKIIKSRELSPDGTPYYTSAKLAPASNWWSMRAVGSMAEKKAVSNVLASANLAPRVYDIIKLQSDNGTFHYAFVVQHVKGTIVRGDEGGKFIARFKAALAEMGIETFSIAEHCDLRPPDFRNNIMGNAYGMWYVDIQNFVFADAMVVRAIQERAKRILLKKYNASNLQQNHVFHVDDDRVFSLTGETFLFLKQHGVVLKKTIVIDMRRSGALFVPMALNGGAQWYFLVNKQDPSVQMWLSFLGYTRVGCDVPEQEIDVFCTRHPCCETRLFLLDRDADMSMVKASARHSDVFVFETGMVASDKVAHDVPDQWQFLNSSVFTSPDGVAFSWHVFNGGKRGHAKELDQG